MVEDHAEAREALASSLQVDGYAVQTVGDGLAALDVIRTTPPDLVLLDLGLPVMTGQQLLAQLGQSPAAAIPIIVITGSADYPKEMAHAVGYMRKPVDLHRLMQLVRYYTGCERARA